MHNDETIKTIKQIWTGKSTLTDFGEDELRYCTDAKSFNPKKNKVAFLTEMLIINKGKELVFFPFP